MSGCLCRHICLFHWYKCLVVKAYLVTEAADIRPRTVAWTRSYWRCRRSRRRWNADILAQKRCRSSASSMLDIRQRMAAGNTCLQQYTTCPQNKNIPDIFDSNVKKNCQILIILTQIFLKQPAIKQLPNFPPHHCLLLHYLGKQNQRNIAFFLSYFAC